MLAPLNRILSPLGVGRPLVSAGGGGAEYLIQDDFESGLAGLWTVSGSGTMEDYTASPIEGTTSVHLNFSGANGRLLSGFPGQDELWFYCKLKLASLPSTSRTLFYLRDGSGSTLAFVQTTSTGIILVRAFGGTSALTIDTISAGTIYHFWLHWTKGTGSNEFASIAFSADGTKPVSGNTYAESTNGTDTTQAAEMAIGVFSSSTVEYFVDHVRVSASEIGDNPA